MLPDDVRDLRGAAVVLGVKYGWLQRHWRTEPGFPPPFVGGGKGQSPRWALAALNDFKQGRRWSPTEAAPVARSAAYAPANDPVRVPISDDVAALISALA